MNYIKILVPMLFLSVFLFSSCSQSDDIVGEQEMVQEENEQEEESLEDAPDFSAETTDGTSLSSAQFKDKTLVIFFFGSACGPCIVAGPSVETKIFQEYKDNDNFAMIGLDQWNRNAATVNSFQEQTGITFPLGQQGGSIARDFGTSFDRIVVVNSEGKIAFKENSNASDSVEKVKDLVNRLLN